MTERVLEIRTYKYIKTFGVEISFGVIKLLIDTNQVSPSLLTA
jgi:hypothetical protein